MGLALLKSVKIILLTFSAGDPNAWRLGRIEEADHETAV